MKRYIAKYRTGVIGYFQENPETLLLIKCDSDWNKLHVTGWTLNQLRSMHYIRHIRQVQSNKQI